MEWKKHIIIAVIIFVLVGLLFGGRGGCLPRQQAGPIRPLDATVVELTLVEMPGHVSERSYTVRAELADTTQKRRLGLAGRPGLEPGYGMLYVYDTPQEREFSEAGTPFALSLAFVREDGTIAKIQKTKANDQRVIVPDEPVTYVLEVRSGWFEDRNIRAGARLNLPAALKRTPEPEEPQPTPAAQHGNTEDEQRATGDPSTTLGTGK